MLVSFTLATGSDEKRLEETRRKTDDVRIRYLTRSRVDRLATLIITFLVIVLLLFPIYGLSHISNTIDLGTASAICMVTLLISTLLFAILVSYFTKAKRHELLGASAG